MLKKARVVGWSLFLGAVSMMMSSCMKDRGGSEDFITKP